MEAVRFGCNRIFTLVLSISYYITRIISYVLLVRIKHVCERPNDADSEKQLMLATYKLVKCPRTL
jgi:hypothetical protein